MILLYQECNKSDEENSSYGLLLIRIIRFRINKHLGRAYTCIEPGKRR
jgi:hypothetical protein